MRRPRQFLPAVAAAVLLITTSACASNGYYRYPVGGRPGIRQVDDRAYRNGYEEGRIQGENDARRGRSFDYHRHGEYKNAQNGYDGYGNRDEYRQVFRQGFETGYDEGYRRFARNTYPGQYPSRQYPSGPVYRDQNRAPSYGYPAYGSPAAQNGFRDGLEQGQRDARDGHRFDPVRASRYREGDHDYNNRYGSRDDYKREYRSAFEQGYQQGYSRR